MSGWGDLFKDKYEQVLDESTGQYIMVDKSAPKYKLDAQGNIINPPPAAAPAAAPAGNGFGALFAGGAPPAAAAGVGGGGGFTFGGGSAAPAAGGFVFGGGGAAAAPVAGGGGGGVGGGFVFGSGAAAAPAPSAAASFGGATKRSVPDASTPAPAKRRRTRELRLTGTESGTVLVVGNGDCGQLGLGDEDDDVRDSLKPVPMPSLNAMRVASLVCGGLHTGALTLDGRLFTWGCNDDEVLGREGGESTPGVVEGALLGKRVVLATAGDSHMCALTSEGQVFAWGTYKDSNGYIDPDAKPESDPRKIDRLPVLVPGLPKCKSLASGGDHVLAVSSDGYEVYGWGCGEKGQLGRDIEWSKKTSRRYLKPTEPFSLRLPGGGGTASAKAKLQRALNENFLRHLRESLTEEGGGGEDDWREACEMYMDHAADLDAGAAGGLDDRIKIDSVACGAYHSFILTSTQNVYSCGLNNMGQLGLGSLEPNHTGVPTLVDALEGKSITSLKGGEHHSLALSESGEVYAFGRGDNNQLGFADGTEQQLTPRLVPALQGVAIRRVVTQSNSNLAVSRSGDLYSWGFGAMGQLCNGKDDDAGDEASPALVEQSGVAGKAVLDAAAGAQHSVVVVMDRPDN